MIDHFLKGLKASIWAQVLVANQQTFERAAFLAKHVAGAHGEAAHSGPIPMDLGAIHSNGNGNGSNTGIGNGIGKCRHTQDTQSNHS